MTVSEPRTTSTCVHKVNPETDRCILCGQNRWNRERAEPSRGAPDAAQFAEDWYIENFGYSWDSNKSKIVENLAACAEAYANSRHVVLLEALRELKDASNSLTGTIRNERKNEQYLRLAKAVEGAEAAIKQAERT